MSVKAVLAQTEHLNRLVASIRFDKPGVKSVKFGDKTLVVQGRVLQGDLCDIYEGTYTDPKPVDETAKTVGTRFDRILDDEDEVEGGIPVLVKVARSDLDNDLVENEANNLGVLYPLTEKDEKFYRYLPRSYGGFKTKNELQAHILGRIDGFVTLADILKAYPKGLDFRDMVWMFKRTLAGIGFAHENKFVHGAILPPHLMFHPTDHGAKIIDWSYSIRMTSSKGGRLKAMVAGYEDFYAPEIPDRRDTNQTADLYMVAKCMMAVLGADLKTNAMPDSVPKPLQDFLRRFIDPQPGMRVSDAWALHDVLDGILLDLVGKPKYRPLKMPPHTAP